MKVVAANHSPMDTLFLRRTLATIIFFLSGFSVTNIHDSQDSRERGKVSLSLISTTSNPLHRHLDISRAITAESSPLHIASSDCIYKVHLTDISI